MENMKKIDITLDLSCYWIAQYVGHTDPAGMQ